MGNFMSIDVSRLITATARLMVVNQNLIDDENARIAAVVSDVSNQVTAVADAAATSPDLQGLVDNAVLLLHAEADRIAAG